MDDRILAVQRMQDYIQTHLKEDITLADLASEARYSPWHSYRLFSQFVGMTPSDYIRK